MLIEMTPLNIFTGQPAISHREAAFERGKDVNTCKQGACRMEIRSIYKEKASPKGMQVFLRDYGDGWDTCLQPCRKDSEIGR